VCARAHGVLGLSWSPRDRDTLLLRGVGGGGDDGRLRRWLEPEVASGHHRPGQAELHLLLVPASRGNERIDSVGTARRNQDAYW
jgi:hypothetical protein